MAETEPPIRPAEELTSEQREKVIQMLSSRGIELHEEVRLLPGVDTLLNWAANIKNGDSTGRTLPIFIVEDVQGAVDMPQVVLSSLSGELAEPMSLDTFITQFELAIWRDLLPVVNILGEDCTFIGTANGYTFGATASGAVRWRPFSVDTDAEPIRKLSDRRFDQLDDNCRRIADSLNDSRSEDATVESEPSDLPTYFRAALFDLFGSKERYERYLAAESDEERADILDEAGLIEHGDVPEVDRRVVDLIETLRKDAAEHLEPEVADRIIQVTRRLQGGWNWVRKMGQTAWASQGGRLVRFGKSALLGFVSGLGMRAATRGILVAGGLASAAASGAGLTAAAVGAGMSGVSFTNLAFDKIENRWLRPPVNPDQYESAVISRLAGLLNDSDWMTERGFTLVDPSSDEASKTELPEGGVLFKDGKGQQYLFDPAGKIPKVLRAEARRYQDTLESLAHVDGSWVENLPTPDLMQRLAEARLYLTRREGEGVGTADQLLVYSRLVKVAIARCGEGVVAAVVEESETPAEASAVDQLKGSLGRTTSAKQVGKAAAIGMTSGLVATGVGFFVGHKIAGAIREHLGGAHPTAGVETPGGTHNSATPSPATNQVSATPGTNPPAPSPAGAAGAGAVAAGAAAESAPAAPAVEWHLNPDGGYTPTEIHKVAEVWAGAHSPDAPPSTVEMGLSEHFVRADMAQKLGLWHDNGDGTGALTGTWKGHYDVDASGAKHYVQELVSPPTQNGVDLSQVKIVDGQFDFSKLHVETTSSLAKSLDSGPWQTSWGSFREAQILHQLTSDDTVARISGYPIETLQAHPDLLAHLRDQATAAVKAQLESASDGKPLPMPNLGGHLLPRATNTIDILKDQGPLAGALHNEASTWADQHGVQLIEPTPSSPPALVEEAASAVPTRSGGYQGWGGSRPASPTPQPGETGYQGWNSPVRPTAGAPATVTDGSQAAAGQLPAPSHPTPPIGKPVPLSGEEVATPRASDHPVGPTEPKLSPEAGATPATPVGGDLKPSVPTPLRPDERLGDVVKIEQLKPKVGLPEAATIEPTVRP